MSRYLESCDGGYHEEIADLEECKHLINEVCTNPDSELCCDFPHYEYCLYRCSHFMKEDGIIREP